MRMRGCLALAMVALAGCDNTFDDLDEGAVYTMNNAAGANYVLVFDRDDEGRITLMDSVTTGGLGSGADPVFGTDPLGSQDAVILSADHRFLFVVNAGSDEVSSFRMDEDGGLALAGRVPSGGDFPVSLASFDDVLYVVNARGGGGITGFRVGDDGSLTAIPGSMRALSGAPDPQPGSIRISPDGGTIVVTEKATDRLVFYALDRDGLPGSPVVVPSLGPTPFGAAFDSLSRYYVSQGNVGPNRAAVPDASSVSSLLLTSATSFEHISASVSTMETAACWVQLTADGRYLYVSNTGSGTISGFRVSAGGALTALDADGRTGVTGPDTEPTDMAVAGGFLFVLTPGEGGIRVFGIDADGSLAARTGHGLAAILQTGATGLAAY